MEREALIIYIMVVNDKQDLLKGVAFGRVRTVVLYVINKVISL